MFYFPFGPPGWHVSMLWCTWVLSISAVFFLYFETKDITIIVYTAMFNTTFIDIDFVILF